ncbi:MAG: hypothetical protein QW416_01755 [Candidatus Nitrosocaldaceae archaeon]
MSNIKIRVRVGSNEIEVESPLELMNNAIEFIPKLVEKIESGKDYNIPNISINKNDSLSDIIIKIFRDDWGKSARRLSEVKDMIESYGLNYPKQSIAVTLMRLAQNGKLRRFKQNNEYLYTARAILNTGEENG